MKLRMKGSAKVLALMAFVCLMAATLVNPAAAQAQAKAANAKGMTCWRVLQERDHQHAQRTYPERFPGSHGRHDRRRGL